MTIFAALLLATTFISPNGEMGVVVTDADHGALYRLWPGGYRQLLADVTFAPGESIGAILVADDGRFVTYAPVRCGAKAELATIHAQDGSIVRTLFVRDVLTANDQQWLCRGDETDVLLAIDEPLRLTLRIADDECADSGDAIGIDLATGAVAAPERSRCPAPLRVFAEAADDDLPRYRIDRDVVPIPSQVLLDRAVVRALPEYPEVAGKARVSGRVGVQLVIGRDGKVETVYVVKPLPFGLDEAARNAISKWEFPPDASRTSGVLVFRFEIVRNVPPVTLY